MLSDASGSWGCGAFCLELLEWFQASWPPSWASHCIAAKELFPIIVGAAIWGHGWSGSTVLFKCDNIAVVQALSSRAAQDPMLSHLLRCLFFFEAYFRFEHRASHIAGHENGAADVLSRN